ncbi:MAG: QueT transporter family protein [Lachnospiraceae bacterium]|nr:QueT transporter family protein [Lachnospiraceae bacterium]MCD7765493.1 QueT transporter family protein [Lachnospiraceae bacterium]
MKNQTPQSRSVLFLTHAALIAALYVVLTYIANALGLANGNIQVRFSEALTILPFFTPAAIPGLYIGCLLANILTGCALPDIIFGPIATLIGALGTYFLCKKSLAHETQRSNEQTQSSGSAKKQFRPGKWLAPIPPIVANAIIVPLVLLYGYGIRPLWFSFVTVTAGEVISCGIFGMILLAALSKYRTQLFPKYPTSTSAGSR